MEKMFGSMMKGFLDGMTEEDRQKMMACCERAAAMCPCGNVKDMPEEEKRAIMERMRSLCGDRMGMMSSFFQCAGSPK